MRIIINERQEILAYAMSGDLDSSIEYEGELMPSRFEQDFVPKLFKLESGEIVRNPYYTPPVIDESHELTQQDAINAQLFKTTLDLKLQLKELKANG